MNIDMLEATLARPVSAAWPTVKFGDVVRNVNAVSRDPLREGIERYVGLDHLDPESLHIRRWGLVADGTTFTRTFWAGQVLFGKRRAYQRKVAVPTFGGICSGDILVFEPAGDELLPELLPFIVQSEGFFQHALGTSAGSLSPRTRWRDLASYEFALPPKDEQRRIADLLWVADETIQSYYASARQLVIGRIAFFEQALRRVIARPVEEDQEINIPFSSILLGSPQSGHSAVEVDRDTGHYVLALSALTANGYRRGEIKAVEPTVPVIRTRVTQGDFLLSRSNTPGLVGLVGIFDEARDDVSFPDTMMRLPINTERVNKRFLEQLLLSPRGRSALRKIAAGSNSSMIKINRTNLLKLNFPIPSLEIQEEIVEQCQMFFRSAEVARAHITNAINLSRILREQLLANGGH